ncbi:MAG TPA: substrate-binding domain-containing protein [Thermomicrobiales bacterium]|nr:substrate-binding domain-containing protein [Thermomicrobiales bacterium]
MSPRIALHWSGLLCALLLASCGAPSPAAPTARSGATPQSRGPHDLILATTTSTQDSGLLDVLIPAFEKQSGYRVKTVAVGSGAAIAMGQRGEADVVLAHAPDDERALVASGAGIGRQLVMYNDFVLVGPPGDPAGVKGLPAATDALRRIAAAGSPFVSRGDNSGTQQLELKLWQQAGVSPRGRSWYIESGSGMGQTLQIADQRRAYTLSDRGTYLAFKDRLDLAVLVEKDSGLLNVYHVILVNPQRFTAVNAAGARAFADFLLAPDTQRLIGDFGRDRFGQPLFTPCAHNSCGLPAET